MMKLFAALALVAIAVSADGYYYRQPDLPCAYVLQITTSQGGTAFVFKSNGPYKYVKANMSGMRAITGVGRPDIRNAQDKEKVAIFIDQDNTCTMSFGTIDYLENYYQQQFDTVTRTYNNRTYNYKVSTTIDGTLCDCYYDSDRDRESLYVCNDYIYAYHQRTVDIIFNYTWDSSMTDFQLDQSEYPKCGEQDSRIYDTPSKDYSNCSTSSSSSSSSSSEVSFTYVQPKLPCAYKLIVTATVGSKMTEYVFKSNGRYLFEELRSSETQTYVTRPDLNKKKDGKEAMAVFSVFRNNCSSAYYDIEMIVDSFEQTIQDLSYGYNNRTYKHKEVKKFHDRKCDCYYDDDPDTQAVYVYEKYIYFIHSLNYDLSFDYTWDAPQMDNFKLDKEENPECLSVDKTVYETPSAEYSKCTTLPSDPSLSSRTHAMISVVLAVLATSLVALI